MKDKISLLYRNPETGEVGQQVEIGTIESVTFLPDNYHAQCYAIFDGRANYDFDAAEILEYIGYEKSIEKVLETTEHWQGIDAVLVDISHKEHYEIVYDYTIDPS